MKEEFNRDSVKQKLHDAALRILRQSPIEQTDFKALWAQGNERAIFSFLDELTKQKPALVDGDFKDALDDFFWLFCH